MEYLDIVNNILKRLRERTVESVDQNAYSALIGILVNDAKSEIENSWNWSALRQTLTLTTQADVFNYELNGTQNNFSVLDVISETGNFFLEYRTAHEFNDWYLNRVPQTGHPRYYSFNGVSSDGDTMVDLYPKPDNTYTIYFNVVKRTADLSEDTDKVLIPIQPVLHLAYAKAIEERGEDGGMGSSSAYATALRVLNDAIAQDAARHSEEQIWTP